MKEETITYNCPGGRRAIAGGTRLEINLERPWQKDIVVDPETCPFCTGKGTEIKTLSDGWKWLDNNFTLYSYHHLLIPPGECWPASKLRVLGGATHVKVALSHIFGHIKESECPENVIAGAHVGFSAGQNAPHLHYHLYNGEEEKRVSTVQQEARELMMEQGLKFLGSTFFMIGMVGEKAGQCYIIPTLDLNTSDDSFISNLSYVLIDLIMMFKNKFKSKQGLPPDYNVVLYFENKQFHYAVYTPVLNQEGIEHVITQGEPGYPVALPLPHHRTIEHLRGKA